MVAPPGRAPCRRPWSPSWPRCPGPSRADGRVTSFGTFVVGKDGKLIGGSGPPGIAVNYTAGPAANGTPVATLERGRWPQAEGEIVLDDATAKKSGYLAG